MNNLNTFDNIKAEKLVGSYKGEDLWLVDFKETDWEIPSSFHLTHMMFVFCEEGSISFKMNDSELKLTKNQVMMCFPNNVFSNIKIHSDNISTKVIVIPTKVLENNLYTSRQIWQRIYYITQHPAIEVSEIEMQQLMLYYKLISIKLTERKHDPIFGEREIELVLQGLATTLMSLNKVVANATHIADSSIKQGDVLFIRFISMLGSDYQKLRTVADFANQLNVTPKYLSSVIKNVCGHTALEVIHHHTLSVIKRELLYSDKSIKEIASEMNFPNISFFGKFVKRELGLSPREFRSQRNDEQKTESTD